MGFGNAKITSIEQEKVEDRDPNLYIKRAEKALKRGDASRAVFECDKAIKFSNNNRHYIFEKVKIMFYCGLYYECIELIDKYYDSFKHKFVNTRSDCKKFEKLLYFLYKSYFITKSPGKGLLVFLYSLTYGRKFVKFMKFAAVAAYIIGFLGTYIYIKGNTPNTSKNFFQQISSFVEQFHLKDSYSKTENNQDSVKVNSVQPQKEKTRPISKKEAISILMNLKAKQDMTVNYPSEDSVIPTHINNEDYYKISLTFTYVLDNPPRTRTTSEGDYYINIYTKEVYWVSNNRLEKYIP